MKRIYFTMILLSLFLIGCKPDPVVPTVVTQEASEITSNSAKISYEVTADGGAEVTSGAHHKTQLLLMIKQMTVTELANSLLIFKIYCLAQHIT